MGCYKTITYYDCPSNPKHQSVEFGDSCEQAKAVGVGEEVRGPTENDDDNRETKHSTKCPVCEKQVEDFAIIFDKWEEEAKARYMANEARAGQASTSSHQAQVPTEDSVGDSAQITDPAEDQPSTDTDDDSAPTKSKRE